MSETHGQILRRNENEQHQSGIAARDASENGGVSVGWSYSSSKVATQCCGWCVSSLCSFLQNWVSSQVDVQITLFKV